MSQAPVLADEYTGEDKKFAEATGELNRQVDAGTSWSGNERNSLFLNLGRNQGDLQVPDFADASAVSGFDFPDDSRAIVAIDWDFDGDLDFVTTNRNAPRLRILENRAPIRSRSSLSIRLYGDGRSVNRDAIGSRVELLLKDQAGKELALQRTLHSGHGFLSQGSKWLHFGIPEGTEVASARVFWNGHEPEDITGLKRGGFWSVHQGSQTAEALEVPAGSIPDRKVEGYAASERPAGRVLLQRPIPIPEIPYTDFDGNEHRIETGRDRVMVLVLWATWCVPCVEELEEFVGTAQLFKDAEADVLALCIDADPDNPETIAKARKIIADTNFPFEVGIATPEALDLIHLAHNSAFLRPSQLPVPTAIILAPGTRIASVSRGAMPAWSLSTFAKALTEGRWGELSQVAKGRWIHDPDTIYYTGIAKELVLQNNIAAAGDFLLSQREWLQVEGKKFAEMLMLTGTKTLEKGESDRGTELLQAAVDAAPGLATARNNLAVALLQSNRGSEAVAHLEAAIATDPDFVDPKVNLARYKLTTHQMVEALALAEEVLQAGYHAGAIRVRAQVLAARGETFDLHNTFQQMVENEPSNPSVWVNLAKLQLNTSDKGAALHSFEKALALQPGNPELARTISLLREQLNGS